MHLHEHTLSILIKRLTGSESLNATLSNRKKKKTFHVYTESFVVRHSCWKMVILGAPPLAEQTQNMLTAHCFRSTADSLGICHLNGCQLQG